MERRTGLGAAKVRYLAVDPSDPEHVLVVDDLGLVRSTDGGTTWRRVLALEDVIGAVEFDPADPARAYAAISLSWSYGPGMVYTSHDGGVTWEDLFDLGPWVQVRDLTIGRLDGESVVAVLATHRYDDTRLYLGNGAGFVELTSPLFEGTRRVAIDGNQDLLYVGSRDRLLRSADRGNSWTEITGVSAFGLATSPAVPGALFVWNGELMRSDDRGATFRSLMVPPPGGIYDVAIDTGGRLIVSENNGGLYRGEATGGSWMSIGSGLRFGTRGHRLAAGPDDDVWVVNWGRLLRGRFDATAPLELSERRFTVEVTWRDFQGQTGSGHARYLTDAAGYFWFFDGDNVEAVVKVLDGTTVNDHFWVFYASLSNVELDVTVRDTLTGESRAYHNPLGNFASFGDVEALPSRGLTVPPASVATPEPDVVPEDASPQTRSPTVLGERFELAVTWRDFQGQTGVGAAIPMTDDTTAFWFFDRDVPDLAVKVLDARGVNGHWWVFCGSLTNVAFTLEVRDLVTGQVRTHDNPLGVFASFGDVEAF